MGEIMNIFNIDKKNRRSLVFLCGPYTDGEEKNDRRYILRDFINKEINKNEVKKNEFLPLIIDYFLKKENINNDSINIQLMEEIIAGISQNTLIFLDTVSASAELGLFTNNNYNNKVSVMIPRKKDIIRDSVGFFIREVMLKNVDYLVYNPQIIRNAIATDYVVEYYGFINNKVPYEIASYILNDLETFESDNKTKYVKNDKYSIDYNEINFLNDENKKFVFHMTIRKIFYLIANIIYFYNREKLDKGVFFELSKDDCNKIEKEIEISIFLDLYIRERYFFKIDNSLIIKIKFGLNITLSKMIEYIFSLILTYHTHGRYENLSIIETKKKLLVNNNFEFMNIPFEIFNFTNHEVDLINNILNNKSNYYKSVKVKVGSKIKYLTKYKSKYENELKNLHDKIINVILDKYEIHENSFAYKKNTGIKNCITMHISSNSFIKYDIKKFFNNIKKKILVDKLLNVLNSDKMFLWQLERIIDSLLVDEKVPLGLMTSPILSDIYLNDFDKFITDKLSMTDIVYTRYADDILFSKATPLKNSEKQMLNDLLKDKFKKLKLDSNEKKFKEHELINNGDHFKYLGVNIVKHDSGNIITVGKRYKNEIAKAYLNFINFKKLSNADIFYSGRRIMGKINYVKMIEGNIGYDYINERVKRITSGRVEIDLSRLTKIILFEDK